jgi:hypothetical protein
MIGYHAVPVIADAYMKGIRGFDPEKALRGDGRQRQLRPVRRPAQYMRATATCRSTSSRKPPPRPWNTPSTTGPSRAWPTKMGKQDIAARFDKRAGNWRNVFDPKRPASCARAKS